MKGFSLIEILIAVALVAIFLPAIGWTLSLSLRSASQGEKFSQAYSIAQEGMEKVYAVKSANNGTDWDWNTSIPASGTIQTDPLIDKKYTRKIKFENHPSLAYTLARKVIVTVSWSENGEQQEVKLVSYVTAH